MRREPEIAALLAHLPLLHGLHAADIARLAAGTTRRKLARGEVIFRRGESVTGLHLIVYGRIGLTGERERTTGILGPRRSFGDAILFIDKPYIVTATALSDALVLHVDRRTILAELDRNPKLARRVITSLSERLHASVRESETYAHGSGSQRFATWLAELASGESSGAASVVLPGAKKVIAARLHMSAEHLSRVLRDLTREGLIQVRGRTIAIADVPRLREWAGPGRRART